MKINLHTPAYLGELLTSKNEPANSRIPPHSSCSSESFFFFFSLEILLSKLLFFILFYFIWSLSYWKTFPHPELKISIPLLLFFSLEITSFFRSFSSPFSATLLLKKTSFVPFSVLFSPTFFAHPTPCSKMSPSLTITMARWECPWPCIHACSSQHLKKPPPLPPLLQDVTSFPGVIWK